MDITMFASNFMEGVAELSLYSNAHLCHENDNAAIVPITM